LSLNFLPKRRRRKLKFSNMAHTVLNNITNYIYNFSVTLGFSTQTHTHTCRQLDSTRRFSQFSFLLRKFHAVARTSKVPHRISVPFSHNFRPPILRKTIARDQ
jgi:hypothetical protein